VIHEGDVLSLRRGAAGHVLLKYSSGPTRPLCDLPIMSCGERDAETAALAVPIFGNGNALLGALSLSGPISRISTERAKAMAEPLRRAGKALSEELGGGTAWT
jgi:hypothetical protein